MCWVIILCFFFIFSPLESEFDLFFFSLDKMAANIKQTPFDDENRFDIWGIRDGSNWKAGYFRRVEATDESIRLEKSRGWCMSVFASDKPNSKVIGAKKYHCMTVAEIEHILKTNPKESWCFYEVTMPTRACRIYLDAEASTDINPDFNGNDMRGKIIKEFTEWLSENVNLEFGDSEKFSWIVLDASSDKKWSHHFVGIGQIMKNPYHVGAAVRRFEDYIVKKYGKNSEWFINTSHKLHDEHIRSFVLDVGVYTEYRVYRMVHQCKYGSDRRLLVHPDFSITDDDSQLSVKLIYDTMVHPPGLVNKNPESLRICLESDGSEPCSRVNPIGRNKRASGRKPISQDVRSGGVIRTGQKEGMNGPIQACPSEIYNLIRNVIMRERKGVVQSPRSAKYYPEGMTVMIPSMETHCRIKGDDHYAHLENRADSTKKAQTYYCFYLLSRTYTQKCFSTLCIQRTRDPKVRDSVTWKLPSYAIEELRGILDGISGSDIREPGFIYIGDIHRMVKSIVKK